MRLLRKGMGITEQDWEATKKKWDGGRMMLLAVYLIVARQLFGRMNEDDMDDSTHARGSAVSSRELREKANKAESKKFE